MTSSPEPDPPAPPQLPIPERVTELEATVTVLHQLLSELAAKKEKERGPSIWSWQHLHAEQAAGQWAGLTGWLDWLIEGYPTVLREFPPCWYLHTEAVEELAALWASWLAAYHGSNAPRDDMTYWHDRWFPGVVQRLLDTRGILTVCSKNKTHTPISLTGAPRNTWQPGAELTLQEHIAADVHGRQAASEEETRAT